jgi:GMP synthase-like glutamine amidotransferase
MRILAIVNEVEAGPGVFGDAAREGGHEIVEWAAHEPARMPELGGYGAAMVFGGAMNVDEEHVHPWLAGEKLAIAQIAEAGIPIMGVCLGAQMLAEVLGGSASRAPRPEIGWHDVQMTPEAADDPVLGALPSRFEAFQWHSYAATPPAGAATLADSPVSVQAYRVGDRIWGIQFHAEVTEASIEAWIAEANDPDAERIAIDGDALLAESREKIGSWNQVGRGISERFFEFAAELRRADT